MTIHCAAFRDICSSFGGVRRESAPGLLPKSSAILSDSITPIINIDGLKFFCPGYLTYTRVESLLLKEPVLMGFLQDRKESILWDVGANIGQESLFAAKHGKRVYAFEPNPANYFLLSKNIVLNNLGNLITAFPFALGDDNNLMQSDTLCEYGDTDIIAPGEGLTVPRITPSFAAGVFQIPKPDFLKVDVDGAELEIIKSFFAYPVGSQISFASIEHDEKQERDDAMKSYGFKRVVCEDDANWYYERQEI